MVPGFPPARCIAFDPAQGRAHFGGPPPTSQESGVMKKLALHWQIAIGLLIGVLYGLFLPDHLRFIAWMGDVFLSALRMIIVPLILTSTFAGIANIGRAEELGRLGFKTILYICRRASSRFSRACYW